MTIHLLTLTFKTVKFVVNYMIRAINYYSAV